ncbi:Cinnamoyl-CoA reductase 1 [Gracilariopsis chorda]|uniref:Cinnamoyl-CoA reductase 1 n=1 Tax=Gracilariopsis chorda TaxID=448386 RepID=A0A2V3IH06_9FLOR|nr:Cinnamoyl-CoA reductase 1 [Gracilariopsis chorda]|eukprot:PXF41371.1 Cinnamoyl-CoA reductase 1 [Gracilariopsis chorda]
MATLLQEAVLPELPSQIIRRSTPKSSPTPLPHRPRRASMTFTTPSSPNSQPKPSLPPRAATEHALSSSAAATTNFMKSAIEAEAPLVAVTGGLSFLGSHVVARMLMKGYFVRTIVPQGANADFLLRLNGASRRLQIIPVRDPAAEDARSAMLLAFRGVSTVVHAASFSTHSGKITKQVASKRIVDALKIALDAASAPGNVVINFIYLSSELSVYDPTQHSKHKTVQLTENDWFDCSRPSRESSHAFAFAHTVAEMRLWARVGKGNLPFNVCSVIPSFVLGPVLSSRQVASTPSVSFFKCVADGSLKYVPDVPMSPVDVRDVARAITALTERPDISGRILLSAESLTSTELIFRAERDFPQYKWPVLVRRHFLRRSHKGDANARKELKEADFAGKDRRGRRYEFSQTRARVELGLRFRRVDETIGDTILSLERCGLLLQLPKMMK